MSIAQRGTSQTGLGNADSGYHTCDRWRFAEAGTPSGVFTQSQSTDVPTAQGFAYSLKMDCTTARSTLGINDWIRIEQKFEGQNLQYLKYGTLSAESLTLSFWVKSNKTGIYGVGLYHLDTQNRHIESNYTINSADTWEKKTITFAGDTSATIDNDNADSLRLWFTLLAGTNVSGGTQPTSWSNYNVLNAPTNQVDLSDSTSNEWYVTGVQLEAGQVASDFEFLPHDVNLLRCQRYCFAAMNYGNGTADDNKQFSCRYSSNGSFINIFYPTQMRVEPSITYNQASGGLSNDYSTPSSLQFYDSDDIAWYIYDVLAEAEL